MAVLDKYKIVAKPPKVKKKRAKSDIMDKVNRNFAAGIERQIKQARAYRSGAKTPRSWVTRDVDNGRAWVTIRYGTRAVPLKGSTKSTIGPVPLDSVVNVLEDVKSAHAKGELDTALRKVAVLGPRKKKSG